MNKSKTRHSCVAHTLWASPQLVLLIALGLCAFAVQAQTSTLPSMEIKPAYEKTVCNAHQINEIKLGTQLELCVTVPNAVDSDIFRLKINGVQVMQDIDTGVIKGVNVQYQTHVIDIKCVETVNAVSEKSTAELKTHVDALAKVLEKGLETPMAAILNLPALGQTIVWNCTTTVDGKAASLVKVIYPEGR